MKLFRRQSKKRLFNLAVVTFIGIAAIGWVIFDKFVTEQNPDHTVHSISSKSICRISSKNIVSERLKVPVGDLNEYIWSLGYLFPPPGATRVRCAIRDRTASYQRLFTLDMVGQSWEIDSAGSPFGDFIRAIDAAPDRVRLSTEPGTGIRDGAAKGHGAYYIKECTSVEWTVIRLTSTELTKSVSANDWLAILQDAKTNLEKLNPCAKRPPPTDK
jgi:hypothetical protein